MDNSIAIALYGGLMIAIWGVYAALRARRSKRNIAVLEEAKTSGLGEPASLHPVQRRIR